MKMIRSAVLSLCLLFFITEVCHAQFMCYVCEDCATITLNTPMVDCDANYFSTTGTTLPSTQTTTTPQMDTTDITTSATSNMDTTDVNTSTVPTTETTMTTTIPIDTTTTTKKPSPPTVGPVETTEAVPTPPNIGTVVTFAGDLEQIVLLNATTVMPSIARQRRQTNGDDYTYHCYSVQKQVNGTWQTDRGCSRVTTMEDVCVVLQESNNGTQLSKCTPCTNMLCNGSATLAFSMLAMVMGVIATFVLN